MKFGNCEDIVKTIQEYAIEKYEIVPDFLEMREDLNDMEIIRIKRKTFHSGMEKTILLADITKTDSDKKTKEKLKDILTTTAVIKESLNDTENVDLYLFLALPKEISRNECLRIESTDQICRKYVLMPGESIQDFLERTFLSKIVMDEESFDGNEPIAQALAKISKEYEWMT